MAVPTLTANSPAAGSIAWSAFNIQYAGVSYAVGAASTANKYVWWVYNSGTPFITSSNTMPTNLNADDVMLFVNKAGIPINVQASTVVDGSLIVDGTIVGSAVIAGTMHADRIQANTLTIGQTSGLQTAIDGSRTGAVTDVKTLWGYPTNTSLINGGTIFTDTILAQSLALADFTNYIADGNLDSALSFNNWGTSLTRVQGSGVTPSHMTWVASVGSNAYRYNNHIFELAPGDEFYFSCEVSTAGTNTASVNLFSAIQTKQADNTVLVWAQLAPKVLAPNTGWTSYTGTIVIPAGASVKGQFSPFANSTAAGQIVGMRSMVLRKRYNGSLIVDGAITAAQLDANAITAKHTLTGPIFQTTSEANRGIKIVSSANGAYGSLVAYNTLGAPSLTVNGQNGSIAMKGDLTSGSTITGATLTGGGIQTDNQPSRGIKINSSGLVGYDNEGASKFTLTQDGGLTLSSPITTGGTVTGATIRTAEAGARVEINVAGLTQYNATEAVITRVGGEYNKFSGKVDAEDIIVRDGLELYGQNNAFASNTKVVLRTGQGGPLTPPTISTLYKSAPISSPLIQGFRPLASYHVGGGQESGTAEFFGDSKIYAPGGKQYDLHTIKITQSDGTLSTQMLPRNSVKVATAAGNVRHVVLGDHRSAGHNANDYPNMGLISYDDNGMNTAGTIAPIVKQTMVLFPWSWFRSIVVGRAFINVSTSRQLVSVAHLLDNVLNFELYDTNDSTPATFGNYGWLRNISFATHRVNANENLIGVNFGMAAKMKLYVPGVGGAPADQEVWVLHTSHQNLVFNTSGVRLTDYEWPVIPSSDHRVYAMGDVATNDFTELAYLTPSNNYDQPSSKLIRYSNWSWKGAVAQHYFTFSWRGLSSKNPEWLTAPSPRVGTYPVRRSWLTATMPALPPPEAGQNAARDINKDVYGWVLYAGTTDSNAGVYRQVALTPSGDPVLTTSVDIDTAIVLSGTNPPTSTQNFPNLSPAKIISSAASLGVPLLEITGDGGLIAGTSALTTLSVGGVSFPSTIPARVTVLEINPAWTLVSVFTNGWLNHSVGEVPARHKLKSGILYAQCTMKSGTIGQTMWTLPVGSRPNYPLAFPGADGTFVVLASGAVQFYGAANTLARGIMIFPADQ